MQSEISKKREKTSRSQWIALLASACVSFGDQSLFAENNAKKPSIEFTIKPSNPNIASSTGQEPPRMISLPVGPAPVGLPGVGLPAASLPSSTPTPVPPSVPAVLPALNVPLPGSAEGNGKVQMRLSQEEPPKLSTETRQKNAEVVRLNVAAQLDNSATMASTSKPTPIAFVSGPVKFSVGDSGVKDFGTQTTAQPPALARTPELVKPKKVALAQTVRLVKSSDQESDAAFEDSKSGGVKHSFADMPSEGQPTSSLESVVDAESTQSPVTSAIVTLPKPDKVKSPERTKVDRPVNTAGIWRSAEVEKDYDIETQGTYSIDAPFEISHVETQDPERCSVFNNGRAITVVGKSEGSTKIAIFAKDKQYRVVRVKIMPPNPKSDLEQVQEMISNLFPDARLTFSDQESGGIEVRGTVRTESEARKVLELIRRICLVPVEDKVRVLP